MICCDDCSWARRPGLRVMRTVSGLLASVVLSRFRTFHISFEACWRIWRLDLALVSSPRLVAVTNDKSMAWSARRMDPVHAGGARERQEYGLLFSRPLDTAGSGRRSGQQQQQQ